MRPCLARVMRPASNTIFIVAAFCLAGACKNGDRAPAAAMGASASAWTPSRTAELFFTTELGGYIEPCGCTSEPLGGLQRLATVVAASKVEHGLVDAGNLLFPNKLDALTREQHLLKSHIMARAYRRMGAIALNVAPADLQAGAEHLLMLQQEGAVPLVSANVRAKAKSGPSVARSFVRTLGGIRFGITGVATPEAVARSSTQFTVIEYASALRNEVSALRKEGAEVVVVLAHVGEAGALELATLLSDVDVIVRAPGTPIERDPSAPKQVGSVLVVEAGSQGQYVGRLRFSFGDKTPSRPFLLDDMGAKARRRREIDKKSLAAAQVQRAALAENPAMAEALVVFDKKIVRLQAKLNQPLPEPKSPTQPHIRAEVLPLSVDIVGDLTVQQQLAGYYERLRTMNLEVGDTKPCEAVPGQSTFVGTKACVKCHEEAFEFWQGTKHGEAWKTLEDDGKHFDLTCVGCHVVGFQQAGGFCLLKDVEGFQDVGCENCHGPGSAHIASEDSDDVRLNVTAKTCTERCHVPEHSDTFDFDTYIRKITGIGHERSAG